jgi:hypothetical protein
MNENEVSDEQLENIIEYYNLRDHVNSLIYEIKEKYYLDPRIEILIQLVYGVNY